MSLIVETGSGIANANSYSSVADADTYEADHGASATWAAATTAVKEQALIYATQYLDMKNSLIWKGIKSSSTQGLDWPRFDAYDSNSYVLDEVPTKLLEACVEVAMSVVINGDTLLPDLTSPGVITKKMVKAGPIATTKEYKFGLSQETEYVKADLLIQDLINSGSIRLVRSG